MSVFSTLVDCPNLQVYLDEAFGRPGNITDRSTFLEYLLSEAGRQGLSFRIAPGNGKIRNVEVLYSQRYLENEVSTNTANPNCTPGEPYSDRITTYTMDTSANFTKSTTFEIGDLERTCRTNPDIFMDMLSKDIDVVERRVATAMATKAATSLIGKWASDTLNQDGTTITNPNLVVATKLANGNIDPTLYTTIDNAKQTTGYDAGMVFSNQLLTRYAKLAETGCCVTDQGVDLAEQLARFGVVFSWDRRVAAALAAIGGTPDGLFVAPGSLALVTYLKSEWSNGVPMVRESANYLYMPIFGATGLPMDLTVKDDCGQVTISVTATPELFGMPDDIFQAGDIYEGVTGVNAIKITNPS